MQHRSAEEANLEFKNKGWESPYQSGTRVTEYTTKSNEPFVRVHGDANQARSWMMKKEAIDGMDVS